jgi:hypothetical protein
MRSVPGLPGSENPLASLPVSSTESEGVAHSCQGSENTRFQDTKGSLAVTERRNVASFKFADGGTRARFPQHRSTCNAVPPHRC